MVFEVVSVVRNRFTTWAGSECYVLTKRLHELHQLHFPLEHDNSAPFPAMPPKGSKKAAATAPARTLVLDNGAYTIKAGLVSAAPANPSYDDCVVIPNCVARSTRDKRTYIASELAQCKDFGELAFRRPVEKGFIVNWEAEKAIWEHEFTGAGAGEGLRVGTRHETS